MNYADHPPSITELKADKSERAADWTPRDALIALLRGIDAGEINPDALVISYRIREKEGVISRYMAATSDPHITLGLLEATKFRIWMCD